MTGFFYAHKKSPRVAGWGFGSGKRIIPNWDFTIYSRRSIPLIRRFSRYFPESTRSGGPGPGGCPLAFRARLRGGATRSTDPRWCRSDPHRGCNRMDITIATLSTTHYAKSVVSVGYQFVALAVCAINRMKRHRIDEDRARIAWWR